MMQWVRLSSRILCNPAVLVFVAGTRPISHRVGRSVGLSHFAFFAFLGILWVGKFVFEHAPAQIVTAPAQPPATGAVVYTALLELWINWVGLYTSSKIWQHSSLTFGSMGQCHDLLFCFSHIFQSNWATELSFVLNERYFFVVYNAVIILHSFWINSKKNQQI